MTPLPSPKVAEAPVKAEVTEVSEGWAGLIPNLETTVLAEFLPKQRWFGGKSRRIQRVRVTDWTEFSGAALMFLEVSYETGPVDHYFAPFIMKDTVLQDALQDDAFCSALLTLNQLLTRKGKIVGQVQQETTEAASLPIRRISAEQSNSSIIYGDRLILKLFRRQQPGPNPEIEIGRFLTQEAHFDRIPRFVSAAEYVTESEEPSAIAVVQALVNNEGDGWKWTLEELDRYYESVARTSPPRDAESAREHVGAYLEAAAVLGRRTAELHLALAAGLNDAAFSSAPFDARDIDGLTSQIREQATNAFDLLKTNLARLPDDVVELAGVALGKRRQMIESLKLPSQNHAYGKRIRIHGDYHLGQVLRTKNDLVILDFEGEPARPLAERRAKYSPLKDVAGMLRSFSYASTATLMTYTSHHPEDSESLEPWARLWEETVSGEFLSVYRQTVKQADIAPEPEEDFHRLLNAYLFDKAAYELMYELNNRPGWVRIPLAGLLALTVQ